jgi:hypothetical protein
MDTAEWGRIRQAFDAVGRQRDGHASGLFWYTDLEQAKAVAKAHGKPILSLRLLGRLDEELSCANSRFFRTTLYPDRDVAALLQGQFVLHWESVRPVPKVTIDFGDGRVLERTVTGNSIHYVLSPDGTPVDALPGLYSARAFLCGLTVAADAARKYDRLPVAERGRFLRDYHRGQLALLAVRWEEDLVRLGLAQPAVARVSHEPADPLHLDAITACETTLTKAGTERPLLQAITIAAHRAPAELEALTSEAVWLQLAAVAARGVRLAPASALLVEEKSPDAMAAGRLTRAKIATQMPVLNALQKLQRSIAEDTVRNEYQLHRRLREWFIAAKGPQDLGPLNRRVYAELFLTPDTDPWLGLLAPDAFNAIEKGGVIRTARP